MASKENVLVFLKRHAGKILSIGQIASALKYDVPATEIYLQQLSSEGEVRRTARGYTYMERVSEEAHVEGNNNNGSEEAHAS